MKRKSGRRERGGGRSPRHASPLGLPIRGTPRGGAADRRASRDAAVGVEELRDRRDDDPQLARCLPVGWGGRAGAEIGGEAVTGARPLGPGGGGGDGLEAGESGVWRPADPRSGAAIRGAGCVGEHGAAHPRGCGDGNAACARPHRPRRATPTTLRAGRAESNVAVGHLHVSAQTPRAALPDGVHGRPLTLHRELHLGAPPKGLLGARGTGAWGGRLRDPPGRS